MSVLNLADALRVGPSAVDKVYLGATQVWPSGGSGEPVSATLTVPSGTVSSDLTGFVTRVDLSDMPEGWWDDVDSDGGNIRVKQSGTVIPFDLVTVAPALAVGELYFKATLTSSSDNVFTIDKSGDGLIGASDANGRNAVWSDYAVATIPGAELINRVDGTALTATGTQPIMGPVYKSPTLTAHDGLAFGDDGYRYTNTDTAIYKYDAGWNLVASNTSALVVPDTGSLSAISDVCVVGDELFAFMSNANATIMRAVVFDADTLAYKRHYVTTDTGWAPAGVCWNPDDGHFYTVGYATGTDVATLIQKWDTDFNLVGTITTASLSNKQGIEYHAGYWWITAGSTLWRVNLDGTGAVQAADLILDRDTPQGLAVDGEHLWVLISGATGSSAEAWRMEPPSVEGYPFQGGYLRATGLPKLSSWTIGVTGYLSKSMIATRTFLSYSSNDSTDGNRASLFASNGSSRYIFNNSTNGSVTDNSIGTPASQDRYRFNATHDTGVERKLYRDGVLRATGAGAATRPGGSAPSALFIGTEDTTNGSPFVGTLTRAYLRSGILSADWLAAEHASWETPGSFYAIT